MSLPLAVYHLLLPVLAIAALPGWLLKTGRRGGWGRALWERGSFYEGDIEFEPSGAVHIHAVSVGEALLAVKLIRAWRRREPETGFVLAVATPTGRAVAEAAAIDGLRVTYVPVDFRWMVKRYLRRFEPAQLVLVEGEMWPNLMAECGRRGTPVSLVNARMSPRSRRRYLKFAGWVRPVFSRLDRVAVQEPEDAEIWSVLGVPAGRVVVSGSMKFDPGAAELPTRRPGFAAMIEACAQGDPVVMSASTHEGEELMIAAAVRDADAFHLCVPRHAERREAVKSALEGAGFEVVLRSRFQPPRIAACLVVDSTGELRDWTAHADVVVIGKSFLGIGGQSPVEAILAGRPLVFGPHMENFEPLATRLVERGAALRAADGGELVAVLRSLLADPDQRTEMAARARGLLERHSGAVERTIDLLLRPPDPAPAHDPG